MRQEIIKLPEARCLETSREDCKSNRLSKAVSDLVIKGSIAQTKQVVDVFVARGVVRNFVIREKLYDLLHREGLKVTQSYEMIRTRKIKRVPKFSKKFLRRNAGKIGRQYPEMLQRARDYYMHLGRIQALNEFRQELKEILSTPLNARTISDTNFIRAVRRGAK